MSYPMILHHGGHTGVTGSCHELRLSDDSGVLVDCGLFQGDEARDERDGSPTATAPSDDPLAVTFPIDHIEALIITHSHIDHCGRLPWLFAAGFDGPIYSSEPTARLLPIMLEDAFEIGVSRERRLVDAYLDRLRSRLVPLPYDTWRTIVDRSSGSLDIRLRRAGHILGSAFVECRVRGFSSGGRAPKRILFSGDLGAPWSPLLPAPKPPYGTDVLVLESTYGDRVHEGRRDRRNHLKAVIEHALTDRGTVLIPSFALGRTQELLYELEEIIHSARSGRARAGTLDWDDLEIVLDSPLAGRITGVFRDLKPFWDAEATRRVASGRRPLTFDQLTPIGSHQEHLQTVDYLSRSGRPCVVIASSGMCSGGRIVNYLKALVGDPRTDVLFVGYQASGTPGRAIQTYGPGGGWVAFDGRRYPIRAEVHTISGYSAHADAKNLVSFVRGMRKRPAEVRLVHGDEEAKRALAAALRRVVPGTRVML